MSRIEGAVLAFDYGFQIYCPSVCLGKILISSVTDLPTYRYLQEKLSAHSEWNNNFFRNGEVKMRF